MDIWYASYGSNLMKERFLAYIFGGIVPGSSKTEKGCRDKTPPRKSELINIPYRLYFSKERSKWGEGGVAFIDIKKQEHERTLGRKYLITEAQFHDVVSQENNGSSVEINLIEVVQNGYSVIHNGWYNRIVYLGENDGAPTFTFTSNCSLETVTPTKPPTAYLLTIANGLSELGLTEKECFDYLRNKSGIKGNFSDVGLCELLSQVKWE
jgi:hypothetical protein